MTITFHCRIIKHLVLLIYYTQGSRQAEALADSHARTHTHTIACVITNKRANEKQRDSVERSVSPHGTDHFL